MTYMAINDICGKYAKKGSPGQYLNQSTGVEGRGAGSLIKGGYLLVKGVQSTGLETDRALSCVAFLQAWD